MSTHHQSQRVSDGYPPLEQEQAMADLDQSVADREQHSPTSTKPRSSGIRPIRTGEAR